MDCLRGSNRSNSMSIGLQSLNLQPRPAREHRFLPPPLRLTTPPLLPHPTTSRTLKKQPMQSSFLSCSSAWTKQRGI
jgi:hypothetical protein